MKLEALFIFLFIGMIANCQKYNRSALMEKYPELGRDIVLFPSEGTDGGTFGYLIYPKNTRTVSDFNIDVKKYIKFIFFSKDHSEGIEFRIFRDLPQYFNKSKKTKFLTHGWMADGKSESCASIKEAYLATFDFNVIILDWGPIAKNIFYIVPMLLTTRVAEYYSKFLNYLATDAGVDAKDIHLIGHSLGAHISGFAARGLKKGKIARITALDPALPGFMLGYIVKGGRLRKEDAEFVDVIHTCGGFLGLYSPIGDVDFYPNGGFPPQPGCSILEFIEACSHGRSHRLFVQSLVYHKPFMATKCDSLQVLLNDTCKGNLIPVGAHTPGNAKGVYYLKTTGFVPYHLTHD